MHSDRAATEKRLARVLAERVRPAIHPRVQPLAVRAWDLPGEPVPVAEALAATGYRPVAAGHRWGPAWTTTWFEVSGRVPDAWAGRTVEALIDLGFDTTMPGFSCEALAYRPDGTAVKALNPSNAYLPVTDAAAGQDFRVYVEAAANPQVFRPDRDLTFTPTRAGDRAAWLGAGTGSGAGSGEPYYTLRRADLAVFDQQVYELAQDLELVGRLAQEVPEHSPRCWELLAAAERALDALDLHDVPGTAAAARAALAPVLAAPAHASAHRISAVGHAHIDTAWLWPLRETVRKVARTVSNVTQLMDDHPGFRFVMSQAQQLAWLKEQRPEVFARAVEKAESGQFLPVGSLWVEPDTNITGGESLVRQFVHGKRFYLEEFGVETEEMWLPDTFGYNAALPQLMKLAGVRWFLTQKISWNTTNVFPHHTFWWEGVDGTRIFSHFPPVDTYNCELSVAEVAHAERTFREKGAANSSLAPFGYGDGGGGPTREMLSRADRMADLEGAPRVAVESPREFFTRAQADYPDAPVWVGELYLELHRGTLTSQLRTKQGNRRCEHLLREAELWCATAAIRTGHAYPYEALDRLWKTVLTLQFHDILPGTSIAWVHREAEEAHDAAAAELLGIVAAAQRALAGPPAGDTRVVFNAAPHARGGIPGLGARLLHDAPGPRPVRPRPLPDGGHLLENAAVSVVLDARGLITSAYDKAAGRETVAPGHAANLLQVHDDFPSQWDAWDIDAHYRNTVHDLTEAEEVTATGTAVHVVRRFGASRVEQRISLDEGSARLTVETTADWHEREKLLKAAFPFDLHAEYSSAEIPFGHVRRPTHTNTSWDAAKFEVCAHRFLHIGERGRGAALVNDSTYGHDITRDVRDDAGTTTTARLTLLRAARYPDPEADQGVHRLTYALVIGATLDDAVREGYHLNLVRRDVPGSTPVAPLVACDNPGVVVESVKLADDRSGDLVVRLYEARGVRARATVTTDPPWTTAKPVDLLERPRAADEAALSHGDGTALGITLRPFQILTLRFRWRGDR
ncbi:alpha-mannosidase [Streptomyces sp. NPDC021020]|uniref:alpha-mannosidase n=1 Tax=Streptomyces sp. NPDC021020 TaxID=3365109 RepID=UPI0037A870DE